MIIKTVYRCDKCGQEFEKQGKNNGYYGDVITASYRNYGEGINEYGDAHYCCKECFDKRFGD